MIFFDILPFNLSLMFPNLLVSNTSLQGVSCLILSLTWACSFCARYVSCRKGTQLLFSAPFIIFLLIEGIITGPEVLNLLDPSLYIEGLSAIVAISISVIVFDGGLHIDLKHIRMVQESVLKLTTIGVLVDLSGDHSPDQYSDRYPS